MVNVGFYFFYFLFTKNTSIKSRGLAKVVKQKEGSVNYVYDLEKKKNKIK